MFLNKCFLIAIALLLSNTLMKASHIIGGELDIQHRDGNRYEVTLQLYFDGLNGQDVVEQSITISSYRKSDHAKIEDFDLFRFGQYTIPPVSNELCNNGLNVRVYTYKALIFLDDLAYRADEGYYLSWQRCCRSNLISNLTQSGTEGFVFYAEIPDLSEFPQNSTPKFNTLKGDYFCVGEIAEVDMSATDADGDALRYSLVTPLAGFSTANNNVISGMPGPYPLTPGYTPLPSLDAVRIDSNGVLRFTPAFIGIFLVAVLCEEYRDGEKIGEIRRETMLLARDCGDNNEPTIALFPRGWDQPYSENDTIFIRSKDDLCHTIRMRDPDPDEFVVIDVQGINYNNGGPVAEPKGAILNGPAGVFESQLCLEDCIDPEQTFYEFRLIVNDDNCPEKAQSSLNVKMKIIVSENRPPEISTDYQQAEFEIGDEIRFTVNAFDPDTADRPHIVMSSDFFDPFALGMSLELTRTGNRARADFYWQPDCNSIQDFDLYKLKFVSGDNKCGILTSDSLFTEIYVESNEIGLFENQRAPDVITPNGDGYNETFTLPVLADNQCKKEAFGKIEIYNRWGRKVFESSDEGFEWRPENIPAGEYFYLIHFSESTFKGYLHLLL